MIFITVKSIYIKDLIYSETSKTFIKFIARKSCDLGCFSVCILKRSVVNIVENRAMSSYQMGPKNNALCLEIFEKL